MSSWAKPGVKCVYAPVAEHRNPNVQQLVPGAVYTIKEVFTHPIRGIPCCRIVEVWNGRNAQGMERGYNLINFRPLITRTQEQDLEHFLPLLKTKEMAE